MSATTATLTAGSFSMGITADDTHPNGLTGSFSLGGTDGGSGSFALSAVNVAASVPNVFSATASNVAVSYSTTGSSSQQIASFGSLAATLIPFDNASANLSNLVIDANGFSLGSGTISVPSISICGILTATTPTLTFTNFGDVSNQPPTGSVTLGAASVTTFPNANAFTATVDGFSGIYTFGTNATSRQATDVKVAVGSVLDATATGLSFWYTPPTKTTASSLAFSATSVDLTSKTFSGIEATASAFSIDSTGVSIGNATLQESDPTKTIDLGGVIEATGLSVGLSGFKYQTNPAPGTPIVTGTVTVGASSISLLSGSHPFTASVTGFSGSYDINAKSVAVKADSADIAVGTTLDVSATGLKFSVAPDAQNGGDDVTVSITSATATLNAFGNINGSIANLSITNDSFSVDSATLGTTGTIKFGSFFSIVAPSVTLTNFGYSKSSGAQFNSNLTLTASEIDMTLGSASATVSGHVTSTISFQTGDVGHFTFSADDFNATLGSILTLSATSPAFDTSPASGGYYAQFGSATATLTLHNTPITGSASNFAISSGGSLVELPGLSTSFSMGGLQHGQLA